MSVIIDDLLNISTKKLREWNYFNHDDIRSGVVSWTTNDVTAASIEIEVDMNEAVITLKYNQNGTPVNQIIHLEYLSSNIGNGKIWYFNCPVTMQRCSKLYLVNGGFVSRHAIKNGMYDIQCKSKSWEMSKDYSIYQIKELNF